MVAKKGVKRERCPTGTHWNSEKKKCVPSVKKGHEEDTDEETDEDE